MRVLLVDVDSKLPNLALMKLSAHHKQLGDAVGFNVTDPERVYASVVFKKNRHLVDGLKIWYPDADIVIGGSGYDLTKKLDDDIERLKPDYALYPDIDYSMGFASRGCIRNCYFCIVRAKEGKYQRWQHPSEFHDERFKKIQLLDNNWYADKDWFMQTSQWIMDKNLTVIENGVDIRIIDDDIAKRLCELKVEPTWHFAFDSTNIEQDVRDGVAVLKKAGMDIKHKTRFYVYVHDDKQYDDAVYRCRVLKELGTTPFIMFNIDNKPTPRIRLLQHWANRTMGFWSCDITEYSRKVHK